MMLEEGRLELHRGLAEFFEILKYGQTWKRRKAGTEPGLGASGWREAGVAGWKRMRKVTGCYGKVREVSRKSTKVRTEQARKSAIVRIFTGKAFFSETG